MGLLGGAIPAAGIGGLAAFAWDPLVGPQSRWADREEKRMRDLWSAFDEEFGDKRNEHGVRIKGGKQRQSKTQRYLADLEGRGAYGEKVWARDKTGRETGY